MKASLIACGLLVVIFVVTVSSQNSLENDEGFDYSVRSNSVKNTNTRSRRSQSCRRKIQKNCTSSTKSCGRLGKANICTSFENDCQRQLNNCGSAASTKFYRKVHSNLCRGLPKNTPRPCGSGSK
ncbi:hypothetical protein KR026_006292, partial [Drosophila bipectinata]